MSHHRSRRRGAALVEAAILISVLTLGLLGLAFFREMYLKKLGALRLARASVIAHSLAGCKANEPKQWVGRDLGKYTAKSPQEDKLPASGKPGDPSYAASGDQAARANRMLGKSGSATSDGQGIVNPITTADFSGEARATSQAAPTGGPQGAFKASLRSRSFVSCSDEVRDGDYDKVIELMKDEFSTFFGG